MSIQFGHTVKEHVIEVPWDYADPSQGTFELFAREVCADGGEEKPAIVWLQGGPGFPAPRPVGASGVMGEALKEFRWILLDQRGTGRSHRIDAGSPDEDISVERLASLRQENICRDAEALREHLGIDKWALFGQSFGGFCITAYCSMFPNSVSAAFLTGGLPTLDKGADELYRVTFAKLKYRHDQFTRQFPWAQERIDEVVAHLDNSQELLPTGERLSSRRFRTIGIELGRGTGFYNLAYLLEDPFRTVRGEKRLKTDFLANVGARVSFEAGPLYAAIHESIYGGVGGQRVTGWSAHRVREEFPEFAEDAGPGGYLTGEHIFPWQFDEDPALARFKDAAEALAAYQWQDSPYDPAALAESAPVAGACIYVDDIFVPFEESLATAHTYRDLRPMITNRYQHNGIAEDGAGIFAELRRLVHEH
ncbi:alpha/beta fold hydrolase [Corynebacterium endometrii]|uniref:Proline iminopeptidase n=1 Tax=Corynebacterium endometrii TaxID=2488819 RepID=A0A4P7QHF4_9CORY|nr:alpha/beta fold hydrolase [Corynebacterium endometrii]QCB29079.1 Proline iminopeptidase [Corynebacterium endometrii]